MKSKKPKFTDLKLDDDLLREAAEIEEEIKDIPLEENPADKERLRAEILMRVLQEEQKEKQKRTVRRKTLQWAAVMVVTLVGIFGMSMTSQANRIFLVQKVEEFFGKRTDITVQNDKIMETEMDDIKAQEEIEKALEVSVPRFYYKPEGMEFSGYEIFSETGAAKLYYNYRDDIITFSVIGNAENAATNTSIDGKIIDKVSLNRNNVEIELWELSNEVNDEKAFSAQWIFKNTYYLLSGNIDQDQIKKIVENIAY